MKRTICACAMGLAIVLVASVSMAQDVVGEWRGDTPQGEMIVTITMGADGKLAGTMDGGHAGQFATPSPTRGGIEGFPRRPG